MAIPYVQLGTFDVSPALLEVAKLYGEFEEDIWGWGAENFPNKALKSIHLRAPMSESATSDTIVNEITCVDSALFAVFPEIQKLVFDLMRKVKGTELGSVKITSLSPRKEITPPRDDGDYNDYYDTYHIVLSDTICNAFFGSHVICFHPGEVFYVDNQEKHTFKNLSNTLNQIHLIVDISSPQA